MEFTKYELYDLINRSGPLWLEKADFSEADLFDVDLNGAELGEANFTRADLSSANLTGAFLFGANMTGANMTGADLSEADLRGADLSEVNLTKAILKGAKYNEDTKWPEDIYPESLGAVLVTTKNDLITNNTFQSPSPSPNSSRKRHKKINYIETEEKLFAAGHGFEFHYRPLTNDTGKFTPGEPVALLELDGWYNNKSKPIHVRIHPANSPKLKGMDEKPDVIIAQVKAAIEHFLVERRPNQGQLTEHIWIWVNA